MAENNTKKGKSVKVVPNPKPETGMDTDNTFIDSILDAAQIGGLDISSIDALSNSAQSREAIYEIYDSMQTDDVISAVIETYAEDTVQTNDKGQVMWIESSDAKVADYTS